MFHKIYSLVCIIPIYWKNSLCPTYHASRFFQFVAPYVDISECDIEFETVGYGTQSLAMDVVAYQH